MATVSETIPELTRERALALYRGMVVIRRTEEGLAKAHAAGLIQGACHTYVGEEAVATGVSAHLRPDDTVLSTHRGHGHALAKGVPPRELMAELFGRATGCSRGRGGSMHLFAPEVGLLGTSGIVGPSILMATGAGYSYRLLGTDRVSVAFFGDGAVNNGAFHEGLNLAAIWRLPVLFVCENNLYATEVPFETVAGNPDVAARGARLRHPERRVDGNDVLAVHEAAGEAVRRARRGDGPTLLECRTYRTRAHAEGMRDAGYRTREEVDAWKARCPIARWRGPAAGRRAWRRPRTWTGSTRRWPRWWRRPPSSPRRARGPSPRARRATCTRSRERPADARADVHRGGPRGSERGDGARPERLRRRRGDRGARRQLQHHRRALRAVRAGAAARHADHRARLHRPLHRRGDDRRAAGGRLHVLRLRAGRPRRAAQPDVQDPVHVRRPAADADRPAGLRGRRALRGHPPLRQLLPDLHEHPGLPRRGPDHAGRRQGAPEDGHPLRRSGGVHGAPIAPPDARAGAGRRAPGAVRPRPPSPARGRT